jgi:hypothetical protein
MDYQKILSEAGRKGGRERAKRLTPLQLTRIAMKGVRARLKKSQVVDSPSALQKS